MILLFINEELIFSSGKSGRRMGLVLLVMICLTLAVLSGCGIIKGKDPEAALREAAPAYMEVLSEHAEGINDVIKNNKNSGGDGFAERPVAFCDINGDGAPELLFLDWKYYKDEDWYQARLSVYTFKEGKAVLMLNSDPEYRPDECEASTDLDDYEDRSLAVLYSEKEKRLYLVSHLSVFPYEADGGSVNREGKIDMMSASIDGETVSDEKMEEDLRSIVSDSGKPVFFRGFVSGREKEVLSEALQSLDGIGTQGMSYHSAMARLSGDD